MKSLFLALLVLLVLSSCRDERRSVTTEWSNDDNFRRIFYLHYPKNTFSPDTSYSIECAKTWQMVAIRMTDPCKEDIYFFRKDSTGLVTSIVSSLRDTVRIALRYPDGSPRGVFFKKCRFVFDTTGDVQCLEIPRGMYASEQQQLCELLSDVGKYMYMRDSIRRNVDTSTTHTEMDHF